MDKVQNLQVPVFVLMASTGCTIMEAGVCQTAVAIVPLTLQLHLIRQLVQAILLTVLIILLQGFRRPLMAIKAKGHILLFILIRHQVITEQHQLRTLLLLLLAQFQVQVLNRFLLDNARLVTTGCLHLLPRQAGVWLMAIPMCQLAQPSPKHRLLEDTIAAANLMTRSPKDAKTALVLEDLIGMAANVLQVALLIILLT